jgi:hypothetical protein
MLTSKAAAYAIQLPWRCSTPGKAPGLTRKYYIWLEITALELIMNFCKFQPLKVFYNILTCCHWNKNVFYVNEAPAE